MGSRLAAVAALVAGLGLLAGVAWAAAPKGPSSQPANHAASITVRSDTIRQRRSGLPLVMRPGSSDGLLAEWGHVLVPPSSPSAGVFTVLPGRDRDPDGQQGPRLIADRQSATPQPTPTPDGLLLRTNLAFSLPAVSLTVTGSGFATPGVVFVELIRNVDQPGAIIGGAVVNQAGAFDVTATLDLRGYIGTYTIMATASDGTVATTPLTIVRTK